VLLVFFKIDKINYLVVKKFFVKEDLSPNEIYSKFINVFGDCSHSFSRIKKWAAEFKVGRICMESDPREGSRKMSTTPEIIEQVQICL
jgi:hypothetical protein